MKPSSMTLLESAGKKVIIFLVQSQVELRDRISDVSTDEYGNWNGLHLKIKDFGGRIHVVYFEFDSNYRRSILYIYIYILYWSQFAARSAPHCGADIPEVIPPLHWSCSSNLQNAIEQVSNQHVSNYLQNKIEVEAIIAKYQTFWDILDDIDKKTW